VTKPYLHLIFRDRNHDRREMGLDALVAKRTNPHLGLY